MCACLDDMRLIWGDVYDTAPIHKEDVWRLGNGFTCTADHRVVFRNECGTTSWRIDILRNIWNKRSKCIPLCGYTYSSGLDIDNNLFRFLIMVQADGHYMYDTRRTINGVRVKTDIKKYYGIEFHFKKQRKIDRAKALIEAAGFQYKESVQSNGTTKIRIYDKEAMALCERHLKNKMFTIDWINMSNEQFDIFKEEILKWDGS